MTPCQPPALVCRSVLHRTRPSWPIAVDNHSSGLPHLQTGRPFQQRGQSRAHSWQQTAPQGDDQLGGRDGQVVKRYLDFKKQGRKERERGRRVRIQGGGKRWVERRNRWRRERGSDGGEGRREIGQEREGGRDGGLVACTGISCEFIIPGFAGLYKRVGHNHWSVSQITSIPGVETGAR